MTELDARTVRQEREFIELVEAADAERLAQLLSRPSVQEEEVLVAYFGEERYRRMHDRALRSNLRRAAGRPLGNVVVLHGIMGAALTGTDARGRNSLLWVQVRRLLGGGGGLKALQLDEHGLREADDSLTVHASGILKRHYGELLLNLSDRWRVRAFWYDWRKSLSLSAQDLAAAVVKWFPADEPVHLVAHSMGGLVARTFILEHAELWKAMEGRKRDGAAPPRPGQLVMLGTPNHGSYDIPRVFAGTERLIRLLALADLRLSLDAVRDVLNTFPGTYHLLPSPFKDPAAAALYDRQAFAPLNVSQRHLDGAHGHHDRLRAVLTPERLHYIAGSGQRTYLGLREGKGPLDDTGYVLGLEGDGRVAHHLGVLDGVPTYYAPTSHGGLTSHRDTLAAISDLLETGETDRLGTAPPQVRGDADEAELRAQAAAEERDLEVRLGYLLRQMGTRERFGGSVRGAVPASGGQPEPEMPVTEQERQVETLILADWLGDEPRPPERPARRPPELPPPRIEIRLAHEDIGKAHEVAADGGPPVDAVAVGHYFGVKPQAAERALDKAISPSMPRVASGGGEDDLVLTQLTLRGTITGDLGQPFFLPDPRGPQDGRPEVLIAVAGMGVPGRFGAGELTVVARELCWALGRMGRRHMASVLIGAGNGNLSPADAVHAWAAGVAQALSGQVPQARLQRITLIEADPRRMPAVDEALRGAQERMGREGVLEIDYPEAGDELRKEWHRQARDREVHEAERRWAGDGVERTRKDPQPARLTITWGGSSFRFGAITSTAAIPEREIPVDPALVEEANDQLAAEPEATRRSRDGRYLGRLLFPGDLGPTLQGVPLVLMLDSRTARVHWELVARAALPGPKDDSADESLDVHLGIGAGVTRQLRTTFAPPPEPPPPPERRLRILVVADPAEDAHLPGAEEEGIEVADIFERFNTPEHPDRVEVVRLFGPRQATRTAVLRHLLLDRFHVLHFAGHCTYDERDPAGSGWIFTGNARLSARELRRIDRVPEFVFSNACESGVTPDRSGRRSAALAPSFAESFFERGVSNFVCTAWPVDDEGARTFARTLYGSLLGLDGGTAEPMYRAMQEARRAVANAPGGGARSWGAYQHYGDPLFRLVAAGGPPDEDQAQGEAQAAAGA